MVLLNRTWRPLPVPRPQTHSRGVLIPRLLGAACLDTALQRVRAELQSPDERPRFEPFTLVMIQRRRVAVLEHRAGVTVAATRRLARPLLFTSSSLGDDMVDRPRRRLFAALLESSRRPLDAQARFHRHRWPDRPHVSVRMARADAATVSHTVVDVSGDAVAVGYSPLIT
jgi:hypothetical protein